MRKQDLCICENKGADQLSSNHEADQHPLYFLNFKPLDIFCGCVARFVSDLVGNPEDRFSHDAAYCYLSDPVFLF